MRLTPEATLKDLQDAAALQAWHMKSQLERGGLSPYQTAYFLKEVAASCIDITENVIKEHSIESIALPAKPKRPAPKRTRKPRATKSDNP